MEYDIALVGNPNVGKTSLYNRITHSLEHVGNWHGVTVSEVSKKAKIGEHTVNLTDLPGLYSLSVCSIEEGISRDRILSRNYDLIINVCEVNNLSRNLYLTMQLLELGVPVVLVINMMDELAADKRLNASKIESALGVPVVPMSAKYKGDVSRLMSVCLDALIKQNRNIAPPEYLNKLPLYKVQSVISGKAESAGLNARWAALKVLENDAFILSELRLTERQISDLGDLSGSQAHVAQLRYEYIDKITHGAIVSVNSEKLKIGRENSGMSRIDKMVLNKYAAIPIFLLVMALIFVITFGVVGKFFTWLLELGIEKCVYNPVSGWLGGTGCPAWIVGLICDGIINGVGGILVFLPQVVLLFFFLALLEDSGYISRVAFMTDGIFRKIGLSGKSAFTLLMGFGCSATALLTARGLEDDKMRKKTVLLTPFMSCSARLPVFSAIAGAYFSAGAPIIVFFLYVLGAAIALTAAAVFEKIKPLKSGELSFIMEMPPYRLPTAERVLQIILNNAKVFVIRVGTTIFALSVIVWMLSNFSLTSGYTVGTDSMSILQTLGGIIAPVFAPLGFGNWKAVTALLGGLVAKEAVISSIDGLGGVQAIFTGAYPALSAFSFMVFTLLYVPCIATLAAIKKEAGFKWMIFSLVFQTAVAYFFALICYTAGLLVLLNTGMAIGVAAVAAVALTLVFIFAGKHKGKNKSCRGCGGSCAHCAVKTERD